MASCSEQPIPYSVVSLAFVARSARNQAIEKFREGEERLCRKKGSVDNRAPLCYASIRIQEATNGHRATEGTI